MKFRVDRDVLGEAVSWVARALPSRPVVPVLSGLLLQADEDTLTLSCFDYEVSARVAVPADVGEPGMALVPGRLLAEITRSLPPDHVEVSSAADMVVVTCGSAEFALVSLALAEYPRLPELPDAVGTVDGGALAIAAGQVVPCASRDDTLPMLTAVCLDMDAAAITLAATDRYRLGVARIGWQPADDGVRVAALVPARTLAEVAKTMSQGVQVTIAFSQPGAGHPHPVDGMISFDGGGRRLTARLIGGEYIKYAARFPVDFSYSAELPAGPFTEAVRRVSLVADRTSPVRLAFRADEVVIEARSDGRARAVESVPVRFEGDSQAISFNPHYLLDGLAAAALCGSSRTLSRPGPDDDGATGRIRLDFTSPAKPALITWAGPGQADPADPDPEPDSAGTAHSEGNEVTGGGSHSGQLTGAQPDKELAAVSPFRYLVVPQRVPGTS